MNTLKTLLTASALALSTTAAFAQTYGSWNDAASSNQGGAGASSGWQGGATSSSGSNIINGQVNLQNNWSNLTGSIDTTGSDATVTGAAAGNLIDITTMNNTRVNNSQIVGSSASIGSNINVDVNNVWGNATVANQVVCNGASVSTDPTYASTQNYQKCNATDPFSGITTNISNVAGNAVVQGSALGNTFEADSNAPNMPILSRQINNSGVTSNINTNLTNIGGTATLSSSAIGNTSQIIHYSTN
jgi:hypothetical protein